MLNAITVLQSGTPFTVTTSAAFKLAYDGSGNVITNARPLISARF